MDSSNSSELPENMREILRFFKENKAMELRIKANELIREAVKKDSVLLAQQSIIAYVLHKILTKEHIIRSKKWKKNREAIIRSLNKLVFLLDSGKTKEFQKSLASLHSRIERIDRFFSRFVQSLLDKARVKYASDAYFLGASLGKAAELTGADKKTLQEYIGATKLHDKELPEESIASRLKKLKRVLGE